jgi:hypothetical protein
MSCRCAAIHAAGLFRRLEQIRADCFWWEFFSREGVKVQRHEGRSMAACLRAAMQAAVSSHAAGFFRRLGQPAAAYRFSICPEQGDT